MEDAVSHRLRLHVRDMKRQGLWPALDPRGNVVRLVYPHHLQPPVPPGWTLLSWDEYESLLMSMTT